jgi:2'-5' RNA ligase
MTFPGESALHRTVRRYQDAIRHVPGLDLIDLRWLHLTLQGIAFVDEIEQADVDEIRRRFATAMPGAGLPGAVSALPPVIDHDAVSMTLRPADGLIALRAELATTIRAVLGDRTLYRLPEPVGGFRPHISIAYANRDLPGAEITARLAWVAREPVELNLSHLSFLQLRRRQPRWVWSVEHRVPLRVA